MLRTSIQTTKIFEAFGIEEGFKLIHESGFDGVDFTLIPFVSQAAIRRTDTSIFEQSDEEIKAAKEKFADKACTGHEPFKQHFCFPGSVGTGQEIANKEAEKMYATWDKDVRVEKYLTDDAEIIFAAYGISARISRAVVKQLRAEGIKAGMIRPITVSPFPYEAFSSLDFNQVKGILDVEMSIPAQMRWDIDHAVQGRCPINECRRSGGQLLTNDQVLEGARQLIKEVL